MNNVSKMRSILYSHVKVRQNDDDNLHQPEDRLLKSLSVIALYEQSEQQMWHILTLRLRFCLCWFELVLTIWPISPNGPTVPGGPGGP